MEDSEQREIAVAIWAAYVKRSSDSPWRREAISVLGADRARALVEKEHARDRVVGAQYRVEQFATLAAVPDQLDG
jgi:hypothetical protein